MVAGMSLVACACIGFAMAPAGADDALGSGFQTFSVAAVAGGQRVLASKAANQNPGTVDSGIPDAEVLMTASASHALSSIAWPSALAGNGGSLLFLAGPNPCSPGEYINQPPIPPTPIQPQCSPVAVPDQVMNQYHYLNSPIRAEAFNPGNGVQDNSVPGATMTARAGNTDAAAESVIGAQFITDVEKASSTKATSTAKVTGVNTAVADARSTVTDINFLDGAITIGAVVSSAHGETNGKTASSSGTTTVVDMKIGGVPVSVDRDGVHVNGQTGDIKALTDGVNQILTNFTIKMYLTRPTQTVRGASTTYDAGSLFIEGPGPLMFEFGGAHVALGSTLPFESTFDFSADDTGSLVSDVGSVPDASFSYDSGAVVGGVSVAPPRSGRRGGAPVLQAELASNPGKLPSGINAWLVVLGVLAVMALAAALRSLPDKLLDAAGVACEEEARRG
jgi:hypothetical protein